MATLIPNYTLTDFIKLAKYHPEKLKEIKTCELTFNCEYIGTWVNPQSDYIRLHTENDGQLSNALKGEELEKLLSKENVKV